MKTACQPKPLLSEAELARHANRSDRYVKMARELGLVVPLGATARGRFVYAPEAVEAVRSITVPVMRRGVIVGTSETALRVHRAYAAGLAPGGVH